MPGSPSPSSTSPTAPAMRALARRHRSAITGSIHLAAQAGVRYSLTAPFDYMRQQPRRTHGDPRGVPARAARRSRTWSTPARAGVRRQHQDAVRVDGPGRPADVAVRRDQARERADEPLLRASYRSRRPGCASSPSTVPGAGPTWRRTCSPTRSSQGSPITLYNHGDMERDFTYIDDIVAGVLAALDRPPAAADGCRTRSTTSATTGRCTCAASSAFSSRRCGRGEDRAGAAAAGRRGAHLRRHRGEPARPRLRAEDPDRGRPAPLRRLVPRVPRSISGCRSACGRPGLSWHLRARA